MASISDKKFYSIDGVELPAYPTHETVIDNTISRTYNSMTGTTIDFLIARKMKVNWKFEYADYDKAASIYKQITDKMDNNKSRFFTITYYDPRGDFYEMVAYCGTPVNFEAKSARDKGLVKVWGFELHFIEVDGTKF